MLRGDGHSDIEQIPAYRAHIQINSQRNQVRVKTKSVAANQLHALFIIIWGTLENIFAESSAVAY